MLSDKKILRELARKYREIAEQPVQAVKRDRYRRFNDGEAVGPMVLIEPDGDGVWREIIPQESLTISDPFLREYEFLLRCLIYRAEYFADDQILEPWLPLEMAGEYTGYHYGRMDQTSAWGLPISPKQARLDGGAYALESFLEQPEDFDKLLNHKLEFRYDAHTTDVREDQLREALGGILDVKRHVPYSVLVCSLLIELVHLRDMTSLMMDLYDEPERFHRVMLHMSEEKCKLLDKLEKDGLLQLNNHNIYTGSGGTGYTGRLPAPDFTGDVRLQDIWGFADAQEFAQVSVEMFREFVWPYQKKALSKFGLACYGCCEPVENKLDELLALPNIWRISVSPWSDVGVCAEKIGRKAIFSRKPNPALIIYPLNEEAVRQDIQNVLDVAANCQVEFVLKDLRTCGHHPEILQKWVDIAKACSRGN